MFRWHYIKDNEYPLDEEECFCEVDEGDYMICVYDAYFYEFSSVLDHVQPKVVRWVLIGEVVSMIDSLSSIHLVKMSDGKTDVASE